MTQYRQDIQDIRAGWQKASMLDGLNCTVPCRASTLATPFKGLFPGLCPAIEFYPK